MDTYVLLLAFFRDHFCYEEKDWNEQKTGKWVFGTEKEIGGMIYQLVANHLIEKFKQDYLVKYAREIKDYSDSIEKIGEKWRDSNELQSMIDIKRQEIAKKICTENNLW